MAEHSQSNNTFNFNGIFDEFTRQALKAKRRAVGVSLQQLGDFLEIHWSTVRKWEAGVTTACHPRHVARVAKFLTGGYDVPLRALSDPEYARAREAILPQTPSILEADLPFWSPSLEAKLKNAIENAIRDALENLRKNFPRQ
ncbi:MAG: transcriptional regulator [Victivallales bacterium]|nr:transcriptional regulator [Victivallales bacterium]